MGFLDFAGFTSDADKESITTILKERGYKKDKNGRYDR